MDKTIFCNGNIITMENGNTVNAIRVENGKITNVGDMEKILLLKDDSTKIIDLQGKTMLPAFIDAHSHLTSLAGTLNLVNLNGTKDFQDINHRIEEFKIKNNIQCGQWITAYGYDQNFLAEGKHPNKELLDKICPKNPVLLTHASGHMGVMNTVAAKELGIDNMEFNGYLEETAFMNVATKIPKAPIDKLAVAIEKAQQVYLSQGITTVQEGLMKESEMEQLLYMSTKEKLMVDVIGYVDLKNSKKLIEKHRKYLHNYINRFKIGGYKIFLDGSPQGRTAWMTTPYEGDKEGYCGYGNYKDEEVLQFVKTALKEKMQLLTHCNGDAASDQLIKSFFNALKEKSYSSTNRPVMIHAQLVRKDQISSMKTIGMIPSYFVAHTYYWGDVHVKNFGMERAKHISPVKETIKQGVKYTFHQDSPVIMPNMIETIWCAVNRITKSGVVLGEDEKISVMEALKGVTINAAYQYFEEDIKGSIKEGKLADLIILDKDPLDIDSNRIREIKVLATFKEGKPVYIRDENQN